jgi:hypothetical protein
MSRKASWRALTTGLATGLIVALSPVSAQATTATEAISLLNAQRAANGIPPVTSDQSLLRSECDIENHEIAAPEDNTWTGSESPWASAPAHESILYNPLATSAAYGVYATFGSDGSTFQPGQQSGWQCMWFGWDSSAIAEVGTPHFYSYLSPEGPSSVPVSEVASEWPATPQQAAGLTGVESGPSILVYALGLGSRPHIVSAALTSSTGEALSVRTVDGTTTYEGQNVLWSWAGDVIPVNPLQPGISYTATVVWEGSEGVQATQTVAFTTKREGFAEADTAASTPAPRAHAKVAHKPLLRIVRVTREKNAIRLTIQASPALYGRHIEVTLQGRTRRSRISEVLRARTLIVPVSEIKPSEVILSSPAFVRAGVRFGATSATKSIRA